MRLLHFCPPAVLVDVACAVELIHAASLVHDDVIDHAQLRRGLPTVSASGDHQAVLYGIFICQSFSLTKQTAQILESMTKAISLMCEGEIEMANLLYNCDFTEADYYDYIYKKTAFFYPPAVWPVHKPVKRRKQSVMSGCFRFTSGLCLPTER